MQLRRLVQFLGGLTGVVLLLAGLSYLRPPAATYFWDRLFDTGHIFVFGLMMVMSLIMLDALRPHSTRLRLYAFSVFTSVALGLAVEIAQGFSSHRDAEWIDLLNDCVGVIACACLCAIVDPKMAAQRTGLWQRRWLSLIAVVVLLVGLIPFLEVCREYLARRQHFPVLIEFSTPWYEHLCFAATSRFVAVAPPADWPTANKPTLVARIDARPSKYPGFILLEPVPDWRGYRGLEIDVYLDDPQSRDFVLRVHDHQHDNTFRDRFSMRVRLEPGFQTVHVALDDVKNGPQHRQLDLRHVDGVALFTANLQRPLTFYLGAMRLTK